MIFSQKFTTELRHDYDNNTKAPPTEVRMQQVHIYANLLTVV